MVKSIVKLPALSWFSYGKIFSGSLGTDPMKGCISTSTFNYRVQLVQKEKSKVLTAVCYFRLPWNAKSKMLTYNVGIFEPDEAGIELATNWIINQVLFMPKNEYILEDKGKNNRELTKFIKT